MSFLHKVFGSKNDRDLKKFSGLVRAINDKEKAMSKLSDADLVGNTARFREKLDQGAPLNSLLIESFAVVREAARRTVQMRHFDVQLIGGIVLNSGKIAEMKTGEGKTLTATLPVYLNALTGKGVHVVTVNDYLAKRDAEWMSEVYRFLGLSTGCVLAGMDGQSKVDAYRADITYGQNNEFGFDYLRDNMKLDVSERAQRNHNFAIVDEVDSILIDEARTPLIISGPSEKAAETYQVADRVVRKLEVVKHFSIEIKDKQVALTDEGVEKVESLLGLSNFYDPQNIDLVHHVQQALRAHVIMKLDVDYVVRGGEVLIVDEFTGRLMSGRRWSNGLHQAVEMKEGVPIQRENQTLATITFQNYFRKYDKLSGMTGTADTESVEFKKIYNLDVIVVPTNQQMIRDDRSDIVYISEANKFKAAIEDIKRANEREQPVLVGTASIEKSELLSRLLKEEGIPHTVLNAKQHEKEAEIVAQAGRLGALTISTNMAGRGTDILLGGNPEFLAAEMLADIENPSEEDRVNTLAKAEAQCHAAKARVLELGGLHIIGTERHESRRIDNQLRGRAGRQGDPGSSRFFISLEDDLMRRFGGEKLQGIMLKIAGDDDPGVEGGIVSSAIERAQRKVEAHHFEIRKHLLEYDDVLTKQRDVVYGLREQILRGEVNHEHALEIIEDIIESLILARIPEGTLSDEEAVENACEALGKQLGLTLDIGYFQGLASAGDRELAQLMFDECRSQIRVTMEQREFHVGTERFSHLLRVVYLQAIDHFWKEHLAMMDNLRDGIGLRGYGQKNPLHEYQREGYLAFGSMMQSIKLSLTQHILLMPLPSDEEIRRIEEAEKEALRIREEGAREIHSSSMGSEEDSDHAASNRAKRRSMPKRKDEDFAPTKVVESTEARIKKEKARKKSKKAKKAKKKAR